MVGSVSSPEGFFLLTEGVNQSAQLVELRQCAGHVEEAAVWQERTEAQRLRCFEVLVLPKEHAPCEAQAVPLVAIAHSSDTIDRHRHAVREIQELGVETVGIACGDSLLTLEAWRDTECCDSPHPRQVGAPTGTEPLVVGEATLMEYLQKRRKFTPIVAHFRQLLDALIEGIPLALRHEAHADVVLRKKIQISFSWDAEGSPVKTDLRLGPRGLQGETSGRGRQRTCSSSSDWRRQAW